MNMFLRLVEICCASFPTSLPILGCFDPPCILLLRLRCFNIINKLSSPVFQQVVMIVYSSVCLWIILILCTCKLSNRHTDHLGSNCQKETYSETKTYLNNPFMLTLYMWESPDTLLSKHQYVLQTTFQQN